MTKFYAENLLLEETNKYFEFVKSYLSLNEQRFALQEDSNETAMYQKLCDVAMEPDKLLNRNTKSEIRVINSPFDKKLHFDFNVSLVEGTIPSHSDVWNHWIGNRMFGMDAVTKANGIDKTQLSNGHRKQRTKRIWILKADI